MSFHAKQEGLVYHGKDAQIPPTPTAEYLQVVEELLNQKMSLDQNPVINDIKATYKNYSNLFDLCPTEENPFCIFQDQSKQSEMWIKSKDTLNLEDRQLHQAYLFCASDMGLLFSAFGGKLREMPDYQIASLDHSIWLHKTDINFNNWHYIRAKTVYSDNARSLSQACIYDEGANLVATLSQEVLTRKK